MADRLPTLTEVVELALRPAVDVAELAEEPTASVPALLAGADAADLVNQVLVALAPRVEQMLESRLRDALAPALARVAEGLIRDVRAELAPALRDLVAEAVAQVQRSEPQA